jgi:hypothetical protein
MGAKKRDKRDQGKPFTATTIGERLLVNRRDAAAILGTSVATICRLESEGKLQGVRLRRSVTASVYFPIDQIKAVAANAVPAPIARVGAKAPPRRRPGDSKKKRGGRS